MSARSLAIDIGFRTATDGLDLANSAVDDLKVDVADTGNTINDMGNQADASGGMISRAFAGANRRINQGLDLLNQYKMQIAGVFAASSALIWDTTRQAAKAEDSINKFNAVFGDFADSTLDWAEDYSSAIGRSRADTVDWLNSFQDVIVPMGFARDEAANLSQDMVQLAADLGSFNNIETEQAAAKLQSALVGNTQAVRSLGIQISAADVEQRAYEEGIASVGEELTDQQKTLATMSLFYDRSSDALGDATRTAGDFNNQTQRTGGIVRDLRIGIGNFFLPVMSRMLFRFNNLFDRLANNEPLIRTISVMLGVTAATTGTSLAFLALNKAAMLLMANPVVLKFGLIVLGITAALTGLYLVVEDLIVGFRGGESVIFDLTDRFLDWIGVGFDTQDIVQGLTDYFGRLRRGLGDMVSSAGSFLSSFFDSFVKFVSPIRPFFEFAMNGVRDTLGGLILFWKGAFQFIGGLIEGLVTGDFSLMLDGVGNMVGGVVSTIGGFAQIFLAPIGAVGSGIKWLVSNAFSFLTNGVSSLVGFVGQKLGSFSDFLSNLNPIERLTKTIDTGMDKVTGLFTKPIDKVVDKFRWLQDTISEIDIGETIKNAFSDSAIGGAVDRVGDFAKSARDFLPFSPAKVGPLSDLDQVGEGFMGTISHSINENEGSLLGTLHNTLGGALDGALDGLSSGFGKVKESLGGFFGGGDSDNKQNVKNETINDYDMEQVEEVNDYDMRQVEETTQSISSNESHTTIDNKEVNIEFNINTDNPEEMEKKAKEVLKKFLKQEIAAVTS